MKSNAQQRRKHKGRSGSRFAAFPDICFRHPNYAGLSIPAKALLHELNGQFSGENNGDLCTAWRLVKDRGLGCRATVEKARDELERTGWIVQTRQGGRNSPNLYALTFKSVDHCSGKLDATGAINQRLDYWKRGENPMLSPRLRKPNEDAA